MKTVSFGGLGDSFISFLKFRNLNTTHHLFVTDNFKYPKLIHEWIQHPRINVPCNISAEFVWDYLHCEEMGVWEDRTKIDYILNEVDKNNSNPYIGKVGDFNYDICIQASAGNDIRRQWKFDPLDFKKDLEKEGLKVCIIGWDEKFKNDDDDNFVCKLQILDTMNLVLSSKVMISNLGFHSLWKLSFGGSVIYFTGNVDKESYLFNEWKAHSYYLENPFKEEIWNQTKKILTQI